MLSKFTKNSFLKTIKIPKRSYTNENENENAKKLKNLAKKINFQQKDSKISRILTKNFKEEDLDFEYTDKNIGFWINEVAREGPKSITVNLTEPEPVIVTVTGAAGAIGYALLPRICAGDMLGIDQPIILNLLEKEDQLKALEGVVMELKDCAFPLLRGIKATSSPKEAFFKADYALLVGSKPRLKGMERSDVLKDNAAIFSEQGKAINDYASTEIKVLVVGNPANTNAMITSSNAPDINPKNITAMTRLDHDRGLHQIANKVGCKLSEIDRFCIWGNHSATQYPDISHTTINGKWIRNIIKDENWIYKEFIPRVQQRGAEIINVRGKSSAASAAAAAISHMRDWILGSTKWQSMAVPSIGLYGISVGIWASIPVICPGAGRYEPIEVTFDEESAKRINISINELLQEKELVSNLLSKPKFRLTEYDPKQIFSWKWHKETIGAQYLSTIMSDHESTNLIKKKFYDFVDQTKELPWKQLTSSFLKDQTSKLDLSSLSAKYSKNDLDQLVEISIRMIEADVDLINRKYLKLTSDLREIKLFGDNEYNNLKTVEEKRDFLLKSLLRDGKLNEDGINTKKIITDQVNLLVQ